MKKKELWTPSARRFECLLKAAQNGDYEAYMSLMARFFKVMDDPVWEFQSVPVWQPVLESV